GNDNVAEFTNGIDTSERPHTDVRIAANHVSGRSLNIFTLDCLLDLTDGDVVRVQLLSIGKYTYLSRPRTCNTHGAHAVDCLKDAFDLLICDFGGFSQP